MKKENRRGARGDDVARLAARFDLRPTSLLPSLSLFPLTSHRLAPLPPSCGNGDRNGRGGSVFFVGARIKCLALTRRARPTPTHQLFHLGAAIAGAFEESVHSLCVWREGDGVKSWREGRRMDGTDRAFARGPNARRAPCLTTKVGRWSRTLTGAPLARWTSDGHMVVVASVNAEDEKNLGARVGESAPSRSRLRAAASVSSTNASASSSTSSTEAGGGGGG
jgi:hypothetical protein